MNDEFGPNFVTLTDDEGKDIELEYIDALEYNGTTYMAFFPVVEEDSEEEENEEEIDRKISDLRKKIEILEQQKRQREVEKS